MIEIPPIQASTLLLCLSMITSNYHSETNPNEYIHCQSWMFFQTHNNQFMPDDNKFVLFMMFTSYNCTQPTQWWSQHVDFCLSSSIQSAAVYILLYYQLLSIWSLLCRCHLSHCYFRNYADHGKYTVDCSCRPILLND